ncbi:MAG: hypothetical protein MHPSP_002869, partial [Paramarteilia canceri]
ALRKYMTKVTSVDPSAIITDDDQKDEINGDMKNAVITRDDFVEAMQSARKSINAADIQRYINFAKKMSSSGVKMPSTLNEDTSNIRDNDDDGLYDP